VPGVDVVKKVPGRDWRAGDVDLDLDFADLGVDENVNEGLVLTD
jgi:hypothetical protein